MYHAIKWIETLTKAKRQLILPSTGLRILQGSRIGVRIAMQNKSLRYWKPCTAHSMLWRCVELYSRWVCTVLSTIACSWFSRKYLWKLALNPWMPSPSKTLWHQVETIGDCYMCGEFMTYWRLYVLPNPFSMRMSSHLSLLRVVNHKTNNSHRCPQTTKGSCTSPGGFRERLSRNDGYACQGIGRFTWSRNWKLNTSNWIE